MDGVSSMRHVWMNESMCATDANPNQTKKVWRPAFWVLDKALTSPFIQAFWLGNDFIVFFSDGLILLVRESRLEKKRNVV